MKVKRAHILLKVDQKGTGWTDEQVAEAFDCTVQTVQNVRRRLVTLGFEAALEKKAPPKPPRQKTLNGRQESQLIAIRLGKPPRGGQGTGQEYGGMGNPEELGSKGCP